MATIITDDSNNYDDSLFDILNDAENYAVSTDVTVAKTETVEIKPKTVNPINAIHNNADAKPVDIPKDMSKIEMLGKINTQLAQSVESALTLTPVKEEQPVITKQSIETLKKERELIATTKSSRFAPYIQDTEVSKIYIQNFKSVYIEKAGGKEKTNICFESENDLINELNMLCEEIVETHAKTANYSEILIPGGIRVTRVNSPLASTGTSAVITLPDVRLTKGKDFVNQGILSKEMLYFLERCVRGNINITVSGNAKEMQMEMLNLLNSFIPETDSVVAIDSKHEMRFSHNNVSVIDESKIEKEELDEDISAFYIAEQLKPDRIVLNEITSNNVVDFLYLNCMNNKYCASTIYANSPKHMCTHKIPLLYKIRTNTTENLEFLPAQIDESMQIIVHITKVSNGKYKVTNICHADGLGADGNVNLKDIFQYNRQKDVFEQPGYIPKKIIKIIKDSNIVFDDEIFKKE